VDITKERRKNENAFGERLEVSEGRALHIGIK